MQLKAVVRFISAFRIRITINQPKSWTINNYHKNIKGVTILVSAHKLQPQEYQNKYFFSALYVLKEKKWNSEFGCLFNETYRNETDPQHCKKA